MLRDKAALDALARRILGITGLNATGLAWYPPSTAHISVNAEPTDIAALELRRLSNVFSFCYAIQFEKDLPVFVAEAQKRHEQWRLEYRIKRYLEFTTEDELFERHAKLLQNLVTLCDNGKLGFRSTDDDGDFLWELYTHVLEELAIRGAPPMGKKEMALASVPLKPNEPNPFVPHHATLKDCLFKYSKAKHVKNALLRGAIRVSPASQYADTSLNPATYDDELRIDRYVQPEDVKIVHESGKQLMPAGHIKITSSSLTNYYVYCLGLVADYRMFCDFEADACLIIRSPAQFIERLRHAFSEQLKGWHLVFGAVDYVDPFRPVGGQSVIFFTKKLDYYYQREFRFVWLPPGSQRRRELEPLDLCLGSLEDICEMVTL